MGKKQQSKNSKSKKAQSPNKQIMKEVLSQLAKNKQENKAILPKLHPVAHINHLDHAKKGSEKNKKQKKKEKDESDEEQEKI